MVHHGSWFMRSEDQNPESNADSKGQAQEVSVGIDVPGVSFRIQFYYDIENLKCYDFMFSPVGNRGEHGPWGNCFLSGMNSPLSESVKMIT